jgi:hypothetical protein
MAETSEERRDRKRSAFGVTAGVNFRGTRKDKVEGQTAIDASATRTPSPDSESRRHRRVQKNPFAWSSEGHGQEQDEDDQAEGRETNL